MEHIPSHQKQYLGISKPVNTKLSNPFFIKIINFFDKTLDKSIEKYVTRNDRYFSI